MMCYSFCRYYKVNINQLIMLYKHLDL